jgi:hypothetical protein
MPTPHVNPDDFQSPLTQHPDFLNKLGLVTAEVSIMELRLAALLAKVSGLSHQLAEAIYFTPKAAIPRIDIVRNVCQIVHGKNTAAQTDHKKALDKATAAMGRRHQLIHSLFAANEDDIFLVTGADKGSRDATPLAKDHLDSLIRDIRIVNGLLHHLSMHRLTVFEPSAYKKIGSDPDQWIGPDGIVIVLQPGQTLEWHLERASRPVDERPD